MLLSQLILDEDMDGSAISAGLGSGPGPDWLKDVVPKVGWRLKVHNALKELYHQAQGVPKEWFYLLLTRQV